MKYILIILLFSSIQIKAQDQGLTFFKIKEEFKNILSDYNCDSDNGITKVANDSIFRNQYHKIFSTVILNSEDIVNNGSAISFTEDKDKNTLSAGFSFFLSNTANWMVNLSANIKNEENDFSFYSDGKWANQIGGKVGAVIPIFKKTQYFNNNQECADLIKDRVTTVNNKIKEYNFLLSSNLSNLKDELLLNERAMELQKEFGTKDTVNYSKKLKKLRLNIRQLEDLIGLSNTKIKALVKKEVAVFDSKNDIFTGYACHWLNINASFNNSKFSIENESIIDPLIEKLRHSVFKFSGELSYNYNKNKKKYILFFQALPIRIKRSSLLDNIALRDKKITAQLFTNPDDPTDSYYNLVDEDTTVIGRYGETKDALWNMDTGLYLAWFNPFQKSLGFSLRANFNFPAFHNVSNPYIQNYSALFGVLLRIGKEKNWSSATITLNSGFENIPYEVNAWDSFLVKASVGIPFNIFNKTKEEEKK